MGIGSKRQANFELLRVVAMFMIISLHYLVRAGQPCRFPLPQEKTPSASWHG